MTQLKHRSKSFRKIHKKLPGGRLTTHYTRRKPGKHVCSGCRKALAGIPHVKQAKLRNMAKTKKRPERPYGGVLCSACMRKKLIQQTRAGERT